MDTPIVTKKVDLADGPIRLEKSRTYASKVQFMTSSLKCIKVLLITCNVDVRTNVLYITKQPFNANEEATMFFIGDA